MTNKYILFNSEIQSTVQNTIDRFNHIYTAMDKPVKGCVISFMLDDNDQIINYDLHGSKLKSIFFGPSYPCIWYTDGKNIYSEESLPNGNIIRRLFRQLYTNRNSDKMLTAILNGNDMSPKDINYYTCSLHGCLSANMVRYSEKQ